MITMLGAFPEVWAQLRGVRRSGPYHRTAGRLIRETSGANLSAGELAPHLQLRKGEMSAILDRFLPQPDVRERHEIVIHAPAEVAMAVARSFDMQSIPLIGAIFWLRAKVLGAQTRAAPRKGLVEGMLGLGWGRLAEEPGRCFAAGAACQPWQADVVFQPIAPEKFAEYGEPDRVKIAWTLEVESLGAEECRFATETRAAATDAQARAKFRRYWRVFGVGIVLIRRLLLPAVRREAEGQWRGKAFVRMLAP